MRITVPVAVVLRIRRMKLRHEPFWLDRLSARRRPSFPRLRTHLDARVVIVGGGLTGAATAWSLAAARVPVVLLEADSVCSGATAGSAGLIREDAEGAFAAHASLHGLRAARHMWQAFRRASLEFPSALRRLGIRCDAARQDLLTIASRGSDTKALRREYDARRAAGSKRAGSRQQPCAVMLGSRQSAPSRQTPPPSIPIALESD